MVISLIKSVLNCFREKYKIFDDLIDIAIRHKKKNYVCEINPLCSFTGQAFVIKSSSNMLKRYNL